MARATTKEKVNKMKSEKMTKKIVNFVKKMRPEVVEAGVKDAQFYLEYETGYSEKVPFVELIESFVVGDKIIKKTETLKIVKEILENVK